MLWLSTIRNIPISPSLIFAFQEKTVLKHSFRYRRPQQTPRSVSVQKPRALFDRSRAGDEDIDQPPGALLPPGAARNMRDTNQRAKQVQGFQIGSYISASDRAFHQPIVCRKDIGVTAR